MTISRRFGSVVRRDDQGRVPFSVIAVVLLIMVAISGAYVYNIENSRMENLSRKTALAELDKTASHLKAMLENQLYMLSFSGISNMVLGIKDSGKLQEADQDRLLRAVNDDARARFEDYLVANFPKVIGNTRVELLPKGGDEGTGTPRPTVGPDFNVSVLPGEYIANDTVPVDPIEYVLRDMGTVDYEDLYKEAFTQRSGEQRTTSLDVYYIASGYVRVRITDVKSGLTTTKELHLSREIASPYPLMRSKLDRLDESLQGPDTPVGRMLSYILGTIGQFNALRMPWVDIDANNPPSARIDPSELQKYILTERDVEIGVSLTLILLLAQEFRDIDEGFVGALDKLVTETFGAGSVTRLDGMVRGWTTARYIDPADVMFMYRKLEPQQIDVQELLGRAIYANFDKSFMNLLDDADGLKDLSGQLRSLYYDFVYPVCAGHFKEDGFGQVTVEGTSIEVYLRRIGHEVLQSIIDLYGSLDWSRLRDWISDDYLPSLLTQNEDRECFVGNEDTDDLQFTVDGKEYYGGGGHPMPPPQYAAVFTFTISWDSKDIDRDIDFLIDVNRDLWESFFQKLLDAWTDFKQDYLGLVVDCIDGHVVPTDSSIGSAPPMPAPYDNQVGPMDDLAGTTASSLDRLVSKIKGSSGWVGPFSSDLASDSRDLFKAFIDDFFDANFDELQAYLEDEVRAHAETVYLTEVNLDCTCSCPAGDACPVATAAMYALYALMHEDYISYFMDYYYDEMDSIRDRIIGNANDREDELEGTIGSGVEALFAAGSEDNFLDEGRLQAVATMQAIPAMENFSDRKMVVGTDLSRPDLEIWRSNQSLGDKPLTGPKTERFSVTINEGKALGTGLKVTLPQSADRWLGNHVFYTDYKSTPYQSTSTVNVQGAIKIAVSNDRAGLLGPKGYEPTTFVREIPIDIDIPITLYTCWPLFKGVSYDLTIDYYKTLDCYLGFARNGLDPAIAPLGLVIDAVCKLTELQIGSLTSTAAFSEAHQKALYDGLQVLIDAMRNVVDSEVPQNLADAVGIFKANAANPYGFSELNLSVLGWAATLRLGSTDEGPPAPLYRDVLHLMLDSDPMRTAGHDRAIRFDLRLVEVDESVLGAPRLDLLLDGTVTLASSVLEFHLDPLMKCYPLFCQVDGQVRDGVGDLGLSITLPFVEEHRQAGWKLSNVVALPSIPIYSLGRSAHLDAGLTVTYDDIKGSELIINEVGMNGVGGGQWVELYNPSQKAVSLGGLSLTNLRPTDGHDLGSGYAVHVKALGPGTVPARGFEVVTLDDGFLSLSNPDPPLSGQGLSPVVGARDGLQVIRLAKGDLQVIDRTPTFTDPGSGGKTWQRSFDGSPRWTIAKSTDGKANDPDFAKRIGIGPDMLFGGMGDLIQYNLVKAFEDAYNVTMESRQFDLGSVTALMEEVLNRFAGRTLPVAEEVISSVSVWFLVVLEEMSDGGEVGLRFSLTFEDMGDLASVINWTIEALPTLVLYLGTTFTPEVYPSLPAGALDGTLVSGEALMRVPQPGIFVDRLTEVNPLNQAATPTTPAHKAPGWGMEAAFHVGDNIPMQGRALMNQDWGDARALFGACIRDLPCGPLGMYFGTTTQDWGDMASAKDLADLWLMRGEIYKLPG